MNEVDARLVARMRAGEEAAYTELVDAYRDRIITVIARVAGPRADAEDLAQDAFIKAIGALDRFAGNSALYTWLYRIAVNTARDWLDRMRRRPAVSLDEVRARGGFEPVADQALPWEGMSSREDARIVREALDRLAEPFRTTLILREMEERSYEEIAEIMAVSVGTVESRIFRARCKLRALLEE